MFERLSKIFILLVSYNHLLARGGGLKLTILYAVLTDPTSLHPAAARGIYLHLHKLYHDGAVKSQQGEPVLPFDFDGHFDIRWSITDQAQTQKARV